MDKIISVALEGSNAVHGRAVGATVAGAGEGAEFYVTLCRPEPGKRPYMPTDGAVTCRTCAKIIREAGAAVVDSAPEPVSAPDLSEFYVSRPAPSAVPETMTDSAVALSALRAMRVYVDNGGNIYGAGSALLIEHIRDAVKRGEARVNGASRVMLDNGRTGRRIVLTIAGRNALGI